MAAVARGRRMIDPTDRTEQSDRPGRFRRAALAWALAVALAFPCPALELAPMVDSILEPAALNFQRGTYGTCINGQTFQIDALVTHAGWQYATWFDAARHLAVGRRRLPHWPWQRFAFDDYTFTHTDVHNVAVIGICPGDGTVHLSFDHHGSPLHYRVSRPGVATSPETVTWSASLFGPTTSELVPGTPLQGITYPAFCPTPAGGLLLAYRTGGSGSGDSHLAEYDPATGRWTLRGRFISRSGDYRGSASRNAYHNGFDFDAAGRLHTTWVWREGLEMGTYGLRNCHDLMYARSDDLGRTWRNNAGEPLDLPIRVDSPGVMVHPVEYRWGMMNQLTQTVDAQGRVHVVLWNNPPDAPGPAADKDLWRFFHYWRETDGTWQARRLPCHGRKPSLLATPDGDLLLVFTQPANLEYHQFDPGGPLRIWTATAVSGWTDWHELYVSPHPFVGEPRLDKHRWRDGVLSLYAQAAPAEAGAPSALHVLDFALR